MTHALAAPERIDEALFMSQVLIEPSIAPRLDAEFGPENRARVLEKVLPLAGRIIEDQTPEASQAEVEISRRYVRHEAVVDIDDKRAMDETMHGDAQILMYEPPLPAVRAQENTHAPLSKGDSEIVIEAAKLAALNPTRKDDDLIALDFLAQHSEDADGRVSKFILDKARGHRRTRAMLTNLLLRIV
jgi:hypothetical protein